MIYYAYNSNTETDLSELKDSTTCLNKIRDGKVTFEQERNQREVFNGYLRSIRKGHKSEKEKTKKTLGNTDMLYWGKKQCYKIFVWLQFVSATI